MHDQQHLLQQMLEITRPAGCCCCGCLRTPLSADNNSHPTMCSDVSRVTMLQTVSTSSGLLPSTSPSRSSCSVDS
jgi:hypothetical protein